MLLFRLLFELKYRIVFVILLMIGIRYTIKYQYFQNTRYFSAIGNVNGVYNEFNTELDSYTFAKEERQSILEELGRLKQENYNLKNQFTSQSSDSIYKKNLGETYLELISASVIYSTFENKNNVLVLNKGSKDGVEIGMGVLTTNSVLGKIEEVEEKYSLVLPLINTNSKIAALVKNTNDLGFLMWDGKDRRRVVLTDLPKVTTIKKGDSIYTHNKSLIFPEGIMIGVIEEYRQSSDASYYEAEILLKEDLGQIKKAFIIKNKLKYKVDTLLQNTTIDDEN